MTSVPESLPAAGRSFDAAGSPDLVAAPIGEPHASIGGPSVPTLAEIAERILALPDVTQVRADAQSGAPEASWGDRFFFAGPNRRLPFATIVEHDTPGFDEDSHLDRPGIFRLNVHVGREEFQRRFGYPPAELPDHRSGIDFTRCDEVLPHPAYGTYGWACVLNPGIRRLPEVDQLLSHARGRAAGEHRRAREPADAAARAVLESSTTRADPA